eukprot:SAG11_NODE_31526_length_291_cov_0.807292_2_plen_50_part_01
MIVVDGAANLDTDVIACKPVPAGNVVEGKYEMLVSIGQNCDFQSAFEAVV